MTATVLVTRRLPEGSLRPLLGANVKVREIRGADQQSELVAKAASADAIVCTLLDRIDDEVLAAGNGRLRIVANVAVGYDNIDLAAAQRLGVTVCNTPGVLDDATADVAFLLLLAAARCATQAQQDLRTGQWPGWELTAYLGKGLNGATLGLVGYGRIGQAMSRRAKGFGLTVLHHTRHDSGAPGWIGDLDELLIRSDFVSLHVPLTNDTHHLIDERGLALMGPDCVLINTARGPIVDEDALVRALDRGTIFAAGLDVYEYEPSVHPGLIASPRTVLLPHIGSATETTRTRMAEMACQAVADLLTGREPDNIVTSSIQSTTTRQGQQ
jgi:glyoxylate reductase